jgi:hypothetical protein
LEKIRIPAYLKLLFKVAVSGLAIWFVFQQINITAALQNLSKFSLLSLFGAIILYNISQIISAHRLNGFFNAEGIELTPAASLRLYYKGMFYNLVLPGSIGGDGYKALVLKNEFGSSWKNLIRSLLVDRISGFIILLYLLIPLFLLIVENIGWPYWLISTAALMGLYPVFYFSIKKIIPAYTEQADLSLALSFFVQLFQVLSALCLGLALGIPWSQFIFIFLLSSVASSIPFTLGGIGAREFIFVSIGSQLSIATENGFVFSVVFYLITVASSLIGGVVSSRLKVERPLTSPLSS